MKLAGESILDETVMFASPVIFDSTWNPGEHDQGASERQEFSPMEHHLGEEGNQVELAWAEEGDENEATDYGAAMPRVDGNQPPPKKVSTIQSLSQRF